MYLLATGALHFTRVSKSVSFRLAHLASRGVNFVREHLTEKNVFFRALHNFFWTSKTTF